MAEGIGEVSQFKLGDYLYKYTDQFNSELLENKVDKEEGKGLSEENFTTSLKNKLDGIEAEAEKNNPVDLNLNILSENAISNSAVKTEFNRIQSLIDSKTQYASEISPGVIKIGNGLVIEDGTLSSINTYELPKASETVLGGIKVGETLTIDENGVLDVENPGGGGGSDVVIDPKTIVGNKTLIADYYIDGIKGELWAPAGGNGQALKEEIYTNSGTTATDITLTNSYKNYDLLCFTLIKIGSDNPKTINIIDTSKLVCPDVQQQITQGDFFQLMGGSGGADWLTYEVVNNNRFVLDIGSQTVYVQSIVGIGLGAGDTVSVIQKTSTGTNIATITVNGTDTELYAPSITVDSAIDATSENPVQNKVIKTALDGKVDTNGTDRLMTAAEGTKLNGIAAGAEVNVQSDWNESDNTSDAYIVNKPTIPSNLGDLSDVSTTGVTSGQVLTYNGTSWEGTTPSGGGSITDVKVDNTSVVTSGVANINTMIGADGSVAGSKGLVPAPASTDNTKFLRGDGTWQSVGGGGGSVTDVQIDSTSIVSGGIANITTMTGAGASAAGTKGLVPAPASGDNEKYLRGDGTWATPSGGGGSSTLAGLTDVSLNNLTNGQILKYNNGSWENVTETTGDPSSEIIPITGGDNTHSRTFTFTRTPKRITVTYDSADSNPWIGHWDFIWGDDEVFGFAQSKGYAASSGATICKGLITYGSDNKSFTITGQNSFQAWNATNSINGGKMLVEYGGNDSGSSVTVIPILTSGTPIATVEVNGVNYTLYAPSGQGTSLITDFTQTGQLNYNSNNVNTSFEDYTLISEPLPWH